MAYADDSALLTDDELAAQQAEAAGEPVTSGSGAATTTGTGSTTVGATTASGAPQFVNLADYVTANESVKDVGANAITSDVQSALDTANTDLSNTVTEQTTAASTQPTYDESTVGNILSGNDEAALTGLSDWWNTAETPTTAPVVTASDAISKASSALDTTEGESGASAYDTYFQEKIGPSAASWLDKAVYGKSADVAREAGSSKLKEFIGAGGAVDSANTTIKKAWEEADKVKKDTKGKLKTYMEGLRSKLGSEINADFSNLNTANNQENTSPSSVHYVPGQVGPLQTELTSTPTYTPDVEGAVGGGILGGLFGPLGGAIGAAVGGLGEGDPNSAVNKAANPLNLGSTGGQNPTTQTVNFNKMGTAPMEAVQDVYSYKPGTQASFDPVTGQYTGTVSKQKEKTWNNLAKFLQGPTLTKAGDATSGSWVKKQTPTGDNRITTKRGAMPGRGK